jgi:hypothetical protein
MSSKSLTLVSSHNDKALNQFLNIGFKDKNELIKLSSEESSSSYYKIKTNKANYEIAAYYQKNIEGYPSLLEKSERYVHYRYPVPKHFFGQNSEKSIKEYHSLLVKKSSHVYYQAAYHAKISDKIIIELTALTNFENILALVKKYFSKKEWLIKRLVQLAEFYYEDKDEDDLDISIESLKSMIIFFIFMTDNLIPPTMTLNEDGTFQVNWRKNNLNLITLMFESENFVDYLILEPSQYTEKPIISNGSMTLFDFIERIKKLNLTYLIEKS